MLTKLTIRNFKGIDEAEIELGNPVVFVGPNDSGKTTALQALTLWDLGLRRWTEKRGDQAPAKRPGVAVNRRDLVGVPVPTARQLWHELRVRETYREESGQRTENIRIDVIVDGTARVRIEESTEFENWSCGLEFDYFNQEGFYCRPLRTDPGGDERMPVLREALRPRVVLLGPMSGLATNETRLEPGAINVRLGEGRTAEVLRNLCFRVTELPDGEERWGVLSERLAALFGAKLDRPRLIPERGEIELTYLNPAGSRLDLTAAGRGMQQTLLLLAFINLHPDSVVLLDEPDAHLEILRQRQTYELLSEAASGNGTQVICASHSEVMLNEAAGRGTVVAFLGSPHRIDHKSEVLKSLRDIGFEDYYLAETTGFVLYVEGATDLSLLRAFAEMLGHEASDVLERPFVRYVGNRPHDARSHFHGLREAKPDLMGFALFDRLSTRLDDHDALVERMWRRREFENYLLPARTLREYARQEGRASAAGPLFEESETERWGGAMDHAVTEHVPPVALRNPDDDYWMDTKLSEDLLARVFDAFFEELGGPNQMKKADYHRLVRYMDPADVSPEVVSVLDSLVSQARRAQPTGR
ncbi:ATP-dependent nuclease [Candidatus Spongiisocius sp.]|uniref:ATP-dependent nuclease n=1 Tax=Candidatus Spongiisocius sp. TaxID=3101273 RepID=UPI003B5CC905